MTEYREDFPLLKSRMENGVPLVYLDNAATSQKPRVVLEAVNRYNETHNANPHRGAYALSNEATEDYENGREKVARFIHAQKAEEIVFSSNTTYAINLVALSYGMENVQKGDEILISIAEHHANLLPWQRVAKQKGAVLRYLYLNEDGVISLDEMREKLTSKTKIVALTYVSNVLGTVNPIKEAAELAHAAGAVIVVDAAQAAPHIPIDVQALDVDFLAFSGHKMLSPAGIGVLYGKYALLSQMEPVILGGGIVEEVREQSVRYLDAPWKFEPGTPNVEGVVGLTAAIDYLEQVGFDTIGAIETRLTAYALKRLRELPQVELYGVTSGMTGILSFNVKGVHPHDTASILDAYGVTVRAGHHCAQPLMNYLGVSSTCRMSLYFYNTEADIDQIIMALGKVREVLGFGTE